MNNWELPCLSKFFIFTSVIVVKILAWMPDDMDLKFDIRFEDVKTDVFMGNRTYPDYFKLLFASNDYVLLGGRNNLYNVSVDNLLENYEQRLEWVSLTAHSDLCYLKGKAGDECQNYIRVLARLDDDKLFICGTNSGRPRCRQYVYNDTIQRYAPGAEEDGVGQCPYNPQDNTTAVYYHGHLYTATVPEFSGGDALIYRKPQRTERSDFKSLNAPNFVSSFGYEDYVFFFYRETAVEYMNCGKAIYSRVARVCKDDKGGPHQFRDRWTTFLKARLNCSIPGDYPFYFDEIQASSDLIRGQYGDRIDEIVYGVMTTPVNAIGGSAICAYSMKDIIRVFEGSFKGQADINANWLPVPSERVPHPRPGQCVKDSRTLSDGVVNFIKTHSLMEQAVPSYFSKPVLVQVSLKYRFTTIAVDPQVKAVDGNTYDILYIGTDNGKLLKAMYVSDGKNQNVKATVISKTQVFRPKSGLAVTGLKVVNGKHRIIVVSKTEVRSVKMSHCTSIPVCESCVELQDPHCAWDINAARCVNMDPKTMVLNDNYLQSIVNIDSSKCKLLKPRPNVNEPSVIQQKAILSAVADQEVNKKSDEQLTFDVLSDNVIPNIEVPATPVHSLMIHQGETFTLLLIAASIFVFIIGFGCGYFVSRRFHRVSSLVDNSVTEQHNHLNRFGSPHLNSANRSSFLPPRANKASNLACNLPPSKNLIKKDNNLDASKELNNSIESIDKNTLQKVKKTYI